MRSRHRTVFTDRFPELAPLAELRLGALVADAELVCLDPTDGHPDFFALRSRLTASPVAAASLAARHPATLMIFDVLHHAGEPVRDRPYRERRALLEQLELDGPAWRVPASFAAAGTALFEATAAQGLEGIVLKRPDARWRPGRSNAWLKVKHRRHERVLVTGWQPRAGPRPDRLLLGRVGGGYCGDTALGVTTPLLSEPARRAGAARRGIRTIRPPLEVTVSCGRAPRPHSPRSRDRHVGSRSSEAVKRARASVYGLVSIADNSSRPLGLRHHGAADVPLPGP